MATGNRFRARLTVRQERPDIWQASRGRRPQPAVMTTEHAALDAQLHDGGWPQGTTTELLGSSDAVGLRLVLPALRQLQHRPWLVFLSPPYMPKGPALPAAGIDLRQLPVLLPRNGREFHKLSRLQITDD